VNAGALVFTDLVGFTDFTFEHGDEAALRLLAHQERVVASLLPPDARVVKEMGDGLFLWFDRASAALAFTVAFRDAAERDGDLLWIRGGLHWGCPAARGNDLIGNDVNLAARLMGLSAPSEILASDDLRRALDGDTGSVTFDEIGPVVVKGIGEPVRVYRVSASGPSP
jgi:adenylate cyclase